MLNISAKQRSVIAQEWLFLILKTYPDQSRRHLFHETDPFRNPVGKIFKEGIPLLVDGIFGDINPDNLRQVLEDIVRVRAVQDFSASEAVRFVFMLKDILRTKLPDDPASFRDMDRRIDEMALLAFDRYVQCRAQISDAQVSEAKRQVALLERICSASEGW